MAPHHALTWLGQSRRTWLQLLQYVCNQKCCGRDGQLTASMQRNSKTFLKGGKQPPALLPEPHRAKKWFFQSPNGLFFSKEKSRRGGGWGGTYNPSPSLDLSTIWKQYSFFPSHSTFKIILIPVPKIAQGAKRLLPSLIPRIHMVEDEDYLTLSSISRCTAPTYMHTQKKCYSNLEALTMYSLFLREYIPR